MNSEHSPGPFLLGAGILASIIGIAVAFGPDYKSIIKERMNNSYCRSEVYVQCGGEERYFRVDGRDVSDLVR